MSLIHVDLGGGRWVTGRSTVLLNMDLDEVKWLAGRDKGWPFQDFQIRRRHVAPVPFPHHFPVQNPRKRLTVAFPGLSAIPHHF